MSARHLAAATARTGPHKVVIAAGGTGGHMFPAGALAAELRARAREVVLMTDARSLDLAARLFAGQARHVLRGGGVAGRGAVRGAGALAALALGTWQARRLLGAMAADAVVGFGGYPSLPPVFAARGLRPRPALILHEQNAVLGRANRLLARRADVLALSFADTARVPAGVRVAVTGNPVRAGFAARAYHAPVDGALRLLVLGGSLGARVFSDVVPAALAGLPEALRARLSVVQQCRAEDLERVRAAYAQAGITASLAPFFDDVATLFADCHLLISRAGASSVAECAAVGRPAILVPLPGAIDDHQGANAAALSAAGGGWMIRQPDFTPAALAARIADLAARPDLLADAAAAAARLARPGAAGALADLVEAAIVARGAP